MTELRATPAFGRPILDACVGASWTRRSADRGHRDRLIVDTEIGFVDGDIAVVDTEIGSVDTEIAIVDSEIGFVDTAIG